MCKGNACYLSPLPRLGKSFFVIFKLESFLADSRLFGFPKFVWVSLGLSKLRVL